MRYEIHAEMSLVDLHISIDDTVFAIHCKNSVFEQIKQAVVSHFLHPLVGVGI